MQSIKEPDSRREGDKRDPRETETGVPGRNQDRSRREPRQITCPTLMGTKGKFGVRARLHPVGEEHAGHTTGAPLLNRSAKEPDSVLSDEVMGSWLTLPKGLSLWAPGPPPGLHVPAGSQLLMAVHLPCRKPPAFFTFPSQAPLRTTAGMQAGPAVLTREAQTPTLLEGAPLCQESPCTRVTQEAVSVSG